MKHGYSIEKHSTGRFIVWRVLEDGNKLRQGSFETEAEAEQRVEDSIKLIG